MLAFKKKIFVENGLKVAIFVLPFFFSLLLLALNIVYPAAKIFFLHQTYDSGQQFVYLAESFSHGHLYFTHEFDQAGEPSFFEGKSYYALGPFSAVILVPFVMVAEKLNFFFYQGFINAPIFFLIGYLVYRLARKLDYQKNESFLLACAFCFASPLVFVATFPISSFYAHVVTELLLLLIFLEYFGKKRLWIISILFGFVLLTRFTAALGIIFFFLLILFEKKSLREKAKELIMLFAPFVFFIFLYALYNWLRFHNVFETGYSLQRLPYQFQTDFRNTGLFGLNHVVRNAFHMFIAPPVGLGASLNPLFWNDSNGISIFLTSMYLLYLFRIKKFSKEVKLLLISACVIAIPLLLSWSTGFSQIGYRFSLDFFPFLFLALIISIKSQYGRLSLGFIALTFATILFNYYLMLVSLIDSLTVRRN